MNNSDYLTETENLCSDISSIFRRSIHRMKINGMRTK